MLYDDAFVARLQRAVESALPRWSLAPDTELRLLTVSENATFLAEEPGGRRVVVRVHRPGYHDRQEILSELAWIEALRAEGAVETPEPIRAADGDLLLTLADGDTPRFAVAFAHMAGREPAADADLVAWFGRLGAVSARLHGHARRWRAPPGFARKRWDYETTLGDSPHWGPWRAGLGLETAGPEATALLVRTATTLEGRLARYGQGPERFGLVHADLRLANLLVDGDRLGVIDFDDCGLSWFAYDFAAAVSFIEHEPIVPDLMGAWIDGYRAVAPLDAADAAEIPTFVMLRRMLLTAWIASHAETPTASALGAGYTHGTVALADDFMTRFG